MKNGIQKYTVEKKSRNMWEATAYNGRFGAMAAVTPQTILWELQRYYPAGSSVEAATAPSRWDVVCNVGTVRVDTTKNKVESYVQFNNIIKRKSYVWQKSRLLHF